MRHNLLFIFICIFCVPTMAQKESRYINQGNKFYKQEKYAEAEQAYQTGLSQNNKAFSGAFNLGNALYRQERYDEAVQQYITAASLAGDDKVRVASSYHNAGNAFLQAGHIEKSIDAYKQALRNNPTDDETRYNLAYAQHLLKKQEQEQNQSQQEQNQNQQEQNQNQQEQDQDQNQDHQNNQMPKDQAEQILNALQQDEKQTQEKLKEKQKQQNKRQKVEKDW